MGINILYIIFPYISTFNLNVENTSWNIVSPIKDYYEFEKCYDNLNMLKKYKLFVIIYFIINFECTKYKFFLQIGYKFNEL